MKMHFALGVLALSTASAVAAQNIEEGYPVGSLAVAAIERSDWAAAERLLTADRGVEADNPARLLNLGQVYMATGRPSQALAAWRQALADPHPAEVTTRGGRTTTTMRLAQEALAFYEPLPSITAR